MLRLKPRSYLWITSHLLPFAGSKKKSNDFFSFCFSEEQEQSTLTELAHNSIALCFLLPRHFSAWNLACPEIPSAPFLLMYILTLACLERAGSAR